MSLPSLPHDMTAIEITAPGGPEVLRPARRPLPVPRHDEVLIRVAHAGVNRPDLFQRAGAYPAPAGASDLPGLEVSGHVAAVGAGVRDWRVGDTVCALLPGGGYAEYAVTPAAHCLPVPEGLSLREAAGLCETAFTVWSNVVMRGGLRAGERFLVHGGSSGIGTMAIQVAHALGARVFATAGSAGKCAACAELGAEAINYREADFVETLRAAGGADLILDMVGGSYFRRNIKAMANDGRMVIIASLEGPKVEANLNEIMARRLTVTGSTLRPQPHRNKARIAGELRRHLWPLIGAGRVRVLIDQSFPLHEAAGAHARMEAAGPIGKIILDVAG